MSYPLYLCPLLCIFFLITSVVGSKSSSINASGNQNAETTASNPKEDEAISRTLTKIFADQEASRFVGLFCRTRCLRQRETLTRWIRSFSGGVESPKSSIDEERVGFHFHAYKRPIGYHPVDGAFNRTNLAVFYFVAGQAFLYAGDVGSESQFRAWLARHEEARVRPITDHWTLNSLLNHALESCHRQNSTDAAPKYLLVVQDPRFCVDSLLANIARSFADHPEVEVLELRRPLSAEMEAMLAWRLPGLSDSCRMLILLHRGAYLEAEKNTPPSKLYLMLNEWQGNGEDCDRAEGAEGTIRPDLTSLQLEYITEERLIRRIQDNQTYIAVGAIGGLAVIVLAVSIFWSLRSV